jgi:hypothetical protein
MRCALRTGIDSLFAGCRIIRVHRLDRIPIQAWDPVIVRSAAM